VQIWKTTPSNIAEIDNGSGARKQPVWYHAHVTLYLDDTTPPSESTADITIMKRPDYRGKLFEHQAHKWWRNALCTMKKKQKGTTGTVEQNKIEQDGKHSEEASNPWSQSTSYLPVCG